MGWSASRSWSIVDRKRTAWQSPQPAQDGPSLASVVISRCGRSDAHPIASRPYARAFHWFRHDFLRARLGPDQDVFGRRVVGRDLVQLAAQERRGPSEAAIRLLEGRGEGRK